MLDSGLSALGKFRSWYKNVSINIVNVTNTPIFAFGEEFSGQHTQGAPNFGEIDSSQGARNIQLGLKYRF